MENARYGLSVETEPKAWHTSYGAHKTTPGLGRRGTSVSSRGFGQAEEDQRSLPIVQIKTYEKIAEGTP